MPHEMIDRQPPFCRVCEGVAGSSLPTDCPGQKLTSEQVTAVYNHTSDFREGRWDTPGNFDWKPAAMPETSGSTVSVSGGNATVVSSGGSHHITTHVDLPEDDEPDETSESGGIRIVPVPIPIPIPIPIPVSSSGNPDAEEEEDNPDPTLDVHVNK